tara:strand:- start:3113 stop:3253 length:141 start_codon:yes stop_codon:yes gene_type:complete
MDMGNIKVHDLKVVLVEFQELVYNLGVVQKIIFADYYIGGRPCGGL